MFRDGTLLGKASTMNNVVCGELARKRDMHIFGTTRMDSAVTGRC